MRPPTGPNTHQGAPSSSPGVWTQCKAWLNTLPKVTRAMFVAVVALTLAQSLGLVSPFQLILLREPVLYRFQLWRLLTNVLWLGPPSLSVLFHLIFLVSYGGSLEVWMQEAYASLFPLRLEDGLTSAQRAAQAYYFYPYFCVVSFTLLNVIGLVARLPLLSQGVIPLLLYVYCRTHPNTTVRFYFDLQVRALYFPWVLMALHVLLGSSIRYDLAGCVVGHLYVYATHLCRRPWYNPPLKWCQWMSSLESAAGKLGQGISLLLGV